MSKRMSDTEALAGKRLGAAKLCTADEFPKWAEGSADLAVQKPQQEDYNAAWAGMDLGYPGTPDPRPAPRPAPGVGSESLSAAKAALK